MFKSKNFCHIASNNRNQVKVGVFVYRTTDDLATVSTSGYFNERIIDINLHDFIIHEKVDATDATKVERNLLAVSQRTLDNVATVVVKSKWEGDIEQEIADLQTYVDNTFVRKDGTSIMTGPLKFRAGSFEGAIAGGLGDGISVYKLKADGSIDSEIASLTKTNGFVPGTNNAMDIGRNNLKWKDLYVARVIASVLNNGANINIPTTGGTLGLNDFSNITDSAKNISNWSSNVTNCITEIPQDIKLELNNGTLTLKAGSKVYVPNGAGVFDISNITADQTYTQTTNGQYLLLARQDMSIWGTLTSEATSGTTPPAGTGTFYNLTTNSIDWYSSGTYNERHYSFPFALITVSNGAISSIDQIFNGFGYIGSTVFALPGVKGLIPNYRNSDGTLKSTIVTVPSVTTFTATGSGYGLTYMLNSSGGISVENHAAYSEGSRPTWFDSGLKATWFDTERNVITRTTDGGTSWTDGQYIVFGSMYKTNTDYLDWFVYKQSFKSVDYSDTEFIAHQGMPSGSYIDLTLGASGTTYTAPADGWIYLNKIATAVDQYLSMIGKFDAVAQAYTAGATLSVSLPASKGDKITIFYSTSGTTNDFKFIYANGAV